MVAAVRHGRGEEARAIALPDTAWIGLIIGAFALYYLSPWLPLSLALLAACAVLCYLRLPLAVSLVPLAMPLFMLPKTLGTHLQFSLGETAIVLCCAAYAVQTVLALPPRGESLAALWRRFVPFSPLEGAIALFLAAATAATLMAHYRHFALRQYREVILEPIAYYVLVVALLREARAMTRALWALVGSGVLVAVLGIGQKLFRPGTLTGVDWSTGKAVATHFVSSVYGSPNNVGLLLDRAIPVAVVLGLAALAYARGWAVPASPGEDDRAGDDASRRPAWLILAAIVAVLAMAAVLALSNSRGGAIAAVAATIIAFLLWRGRREPRLELAGLAIVVIGAAGVLWKFRHGLSTSARIHVWLSGLAMIRDHPLFGVGPDNFLYYYVNRKVIDPTNPSERCVVGIALPSRSYMDTVHAWQEPCLSHPHNMLLDVWLSTGLIGLVAMALIVGGFALLIWRGLRLLPMGAHRAVVVAGAAIVVATLGHGLVDNSIFVPDIAVAFWLALALAGNAIGARARLSR